MKTMKTMKTMAMAKAAVAVAVIGLVWALAAPPDAQAQAQALQVQTNLVAVSNTTATTTTALPVRLLPGEPFDLYVKYAATNAGTSNVIWKLDLSPDKINWTTTTPLTATNAANGTNAILQRFPFTAAQVGAARWVRLGAITTTQTNSIFTSNAWVALPR